MGRATAITRRTGTTSAGAVLATVAAAAALAGCGGGTPEELAIAAPVAESLASRSDRVAEQLARGDACAAAREADDLRVEAVEAVNDGHVPAALQEELLASANELAQSIECPPAELVQPPARDDGGNGKGKDDDRDEDDDEDDGKRDGNGEGKGEDSDEDDGRGSGKGEGGG